MTQEWGEVKSTQGSHIVSSENSGLFMTERVLWMLTSMTIEFDGVRSLNVHMSTTQ